MRKLLEFIIAELNAGRRVVSAVIIASSGSTPRTTGSRMAVAADGRTCGTVGGGPGESITCRHARQAHDSGVSRILGLDLTGKDVAAEGMICGGRLAILIDCIEASPQNAALFQSLLESRDAGNGRVLYTAFYENADSVEVLCRTTDPGRLPDAVPETLHRTVERRAGKSRLPFAESENGFTVLAEPIRSAGRVLIAGAGHVGRATAVMASYVGFHTVVMDDRSDFLDPTRFPGHCRLRRIDGFADCFTDLAVGADSMIVIVTRGHLHDRNVLAQALKTHAGYIGMIGSRKKRNAIYERLQNEGFSRTDTDRVHSPIGLSIGADTPEEIAVSIVAELIQKRAET